MNPGIARAVRTLRARHLDPLQREAESFLLWWQAQLLELLPAELRNRIEQGSRRLFVEVGSGAIKLRVGASLQAGMLQGVAVDTAAGAALPAGLRDMEAIALLPPDQVLRTSLRLPLAARENLREVLAFEMDRHTPFTADKVYYDSIVTGCDPDQQLMTVDLVYTTRATVDEFLDKLSRFRISADVVTTRDAAGPEPLAVNLLPPERRIPRPGPLPRLNAALAGLAAVLSILAIGLPPMRKADLVEALEPRVEAAAAMARETSQLRDEVAALAEGARLLTSRKQSQLLVVEVIEEVSELLPDDTSLNRLDISGNSLELHGQSRSAAALIAIIEASPQLQNARFSSPVSQISATGIDRFHLTADIVWQKSQ